jgi:dihydroxyacetone kinase-like protein
MVNIVVSDIVRAVARLAAAAEGAAEMLNAADGRLGDGDLGITLSNGWREAAKRTEGLSGDVGLAFLETAKAFQAACASSFGTLTATGLMSVAAACKGRSEIPWSEVPALLAGAMDAMRKRGKGELGQKSVLDIINALAIATSGCDSPSEQAVVARQACERTLEQFRDRPNGLGRARMFAEKSVGVDDPGMLAVQVMVCALID